MLALYLSSTLPLLAVATNADRVTDRLVVRKDVVEPPLYRADHNSARPLGTFVSNKLSCKVRVALCKFRRRQLCFIRLGGEGARDLRLRKVGRNRLAAPRYQYDGVYADDETPLWKHENEPGGRSPSRSVNTAILLLM